MAFQDYIEIPNNNEVFTIGNDEVDILQKGVYEITFCGQITGVDQNHGAIFYLTEKDIFHYLLLLDIINYLS